MYMTNGEKPQTSAKTNNNLFWLNNLSCRFFERKGTKGQRLKMSHRIVFTKLIFNEEDKVDK